MAGEEVFVSNTLLSIGSAFLFLVLYVFYDMFDLAQHQHDGKPQQHDGKPQQKPVFSIRNLLKPLFFMAAMAAILNGWQGQYVAYKVTGLADNANYINGFWLSALPWLLYGVLAAALIDLATIGVQSLFNALSGGQGRRNG